MEKTNSHSEKVQRYNSIEKEGKSTCIRFLRCRIRIVAEFLLLAALLISWAVMGFKTQQSCPLSNSASCPVSRSTSSCVDGWIGYRGKCYYFSEAEGNWTYSQNNCSSLGASLAVIDARQDLDFILRYKGTTDPWIGLQRGSDHHWKWTNGTKFNNLFEVRGDANCAFLTETAVSSSRCYTVRSWICNKPYA
ncbi:early activation antigen CD69-like isoform X2 [Malaclemys terrapin pileata]|uniref:early activation antigen CD69-like isoform X2 n=1 Tax=Malaclemys terrapin pileata TaxID=2991368 RepID=UPI0023A839D2|nr:early activation antigen CD69-like isoform X2 [Malaclemys terrapin pileata]XP_053904445.1 early activation antigen CD69-like isoform X2 [Malaclemys terrapin pileata]